MSARFFAKLAAVAAAVTLGSTCYANLIVNQNLGTLAATTPISGTTVGQANEADTYFPPGNTAAIWDQDFVYQFTINSPMTIGVTTNDPNGSTLDNDFFLLRDLTTTINSNGLRQATVVHSNLVEQSGVFGNYAPGTYYLSVDAWRGNPTVAGTPPEGRAGAYAGTINLTPFTPPPPPPSTSTTLGGSTSGNLGAGEIKWYSFDYSGSGGFNIDTEGSVLGPSNDTELGLYDVLGNLVASDDDSGTGNLSLLAAPPGLAVGRYWLALGGFNTTYATGFVVTSTSTNTGSFIINGLSVPEPASAMTLALAGVAFSIRRRARRV